MCFRTSTGTVVGLVLPALLLTPQLTADNFTWNPPPGQRAWSDFLNWDGTPNQWPDDNTDSALISGPTADDPILDANYFIGALTLQALGDAATGDGVTNFRLVVQDIGGLLGLTYIGSGSTLIVYRSTAAFNDFDTDDLTIAPGGEMRILDSARVQVDDLLDVDAGGEIVGWGALDISGTTDPNNDGRLRASDGGTLTVTGASVTFDIDGALEDGALETSSFSTLVLDLDVGTLFDGTMTIGPGGEIRINDTWQLASTPGTVLTFSGGAGPNPTTLSGTGVTLAGTVVVGFGTAWLAAPTTITSTATVDVEGPGHSLHIEDVTEVAAGASFTGTGELLVNTGGTLRLESTANVGIPVSNSGQILVGTSPGFATVGGFEQSGTGRFDVEIGGPVVGLHYDRLVVDGAASLSGRLDLALISGFVPVPGQTFAVLTASGGVTGQFSEVTGLPYVQMIYSPNVATVRIPLVCPWDCGDGDGTVGVVDLLTLLAQWGVDGDCEFNGDNQVNVVDLLDLLGAWGACPDSACTAVAGSCCIDNFSPGCEDPDCCSAICAVDPFCCNTHWDVVCANQAAALCGVCGGG